MKSCRQVTRLLSEQLERPLGLGERMQLRVHCWMCSGCNNFGQHMQQLRLISRHFAKKPDGGPSSGSSGD